MAFPYELAQSPAQEPYTADLYERLAKEVAKDCKQHNIPPVMITVFDQTGSVPTGIVRHDRCENGRKLGKTDPGDQFDEARFIALLQAEMEADMALDPKADYPTFAKMFKRASADDSLYTWGGATPIARGTYSLVDRLHAMAATLTHHHRDQPTVERQGVIPGIMMRHEPIEDETAALQDQINELKAQVAALTASSSGVSEAKAEEIAPPGRRGRGRKTEGC